ncbi:bifunctional DNA-formamidopyrimidine glycosylase/DNA-(apurinic or apyrimidinic site) lyase [Legionella londiniensis]|uniref:Formamidopyrimidine-DNA glycosylase n=1 Tax=Legionella londiniensis TaxID=45068 RepID=A0A0W0VS11_9GAMM|nr:bifunctional DNA-formamidopyrimidine glycosylase/DNA-(apurinic or apyrimidinic site) lyase [Legionella londiniensis]KTD23012.1 formamidopyrimidine-DNA glycosylase MutM [Legionella londiniensis]STX94028.1 formamidopyrimidine-DNA glycosylase MutM [Legionella londiniensis]
MPELPEVETTKRGISSFLLKQTIADIIVRQSKLRLPVDDGIRTRCRGQQIVGIARRGKYLILELPPGALLIHLGMSGHLRIVDRESPIKKHDHIDLILTSGYILRYHDPRRFGLWLYAPNPAGEHPLLSHLGLEPLSDEFTGDYLFLKSRNKQQPVKSFIMDNRVVVGVGNIYASESLFLANIHPTMPAGAIPHKQYIRLAQQIKSVLQQAIEQGGTTLRDFYASDGKPGYFSLSLQIYGRQGLACVRCEATIESTIIAGRKSAFCPQCQNQAGHISDA